MNISQLQERLRLELSRRIERGTLTGTLLARQTGFRQSHISNFLHGKRLLSVHALDAILLAVHLSVSDLLPERDSVPRHSDHSDEIPSTVPLVSQATLMYEPQVRPASIVEEIRIPSDMLHEVHAHVTPTRKRWQRFLAIRVSSLQARAMTPLLQPRAILIIDRHSNILPTHEAGEPTLYAVRGGNILYLRFAAFAARRLILRPYRLDHPIELLELDGDELPSDRIIGRVCLCVSEL